MRHNRLALVHPPKDPSSLDRARRVLNLEGPEFLGDHELLALCLSTTTRNGRHLAGAARILETVGGLAKLRSLRAPGIAHQTRLSEGQAIRLCASLELGRRANLDAARPLPPRPLGQREVEAWALPRLAGLDHEEVWVLCVNASGHLQSTFLVGRGGIHGCGLLSRDILVPVVRDGASAFVLVHNHPSGDPTPSAEDVELTRSLEAAARTLCVPLLDHVVVARGGARSFFELGLLPRDSCDE